MVVFGGKTSAGDLIVAEHAVGGDAGSCAVYRSANCKRGPSVVDFICPFPMPRGAEARMDGVHHAESVPLIEPAQPVRRDQTPLVDSCALRKMRGKLTHDPRLTSIRSA